MKRRLLNLAAAVSLGMMLAIAALWVRSYFAYDRFGWSSMRQGLETVPRMRYTTRVVIWRLDISRGQAVFVRIATDGDTWAPPINGHQRFPAQAVRPALPSLKGWDRALAGFGFVRSVTLRKEMTENDWGVGVPFWFLALLAACAPLCWLMRRRGKDSDQGRLCSVCGYDLRATPERCPECGTAAGTAAAEGGLA